MKSSNSQLVHRQVCFVEQNPHLYIVEWTSPPNQTYTYQYIRRIMSLAHWQFPRNFSTTSTPAETKPYITPPLALLIQLSSPPHSNYAFHHHPSTAIHAVCPLFRPVPPPQLTNKTPIQRVRRIQLRLRGLLGCIPQRDAELLPDRSAVGTRHGLYCGSRAVCCMCYSAVCVWTCGWLGSVWMRPAH